MFSRLFLAIAILALSLSALADDPPDRLGDMVRQLGDERPEVRDRAEKALTEAGEPALAELDKAADSKDPELASRARLIAEGIRQELEMKRPHDSRESWARLFAAVKPGADLHAIARLARRASALDAAGNEGQGTVDGVGFFFWQLDPSWRLWVETDPVEPDTIKLAEVVGFEDLRPEFKDDYELCRAIHETRPFSVAFDPAACIRAVNALRAAGKDRALAACRAYLAVLRDVRLRRYKFGLDTERLFPILRLLFTDAAGKPFLPVPGSTWSFTPPAPTDPGTFPIFLVDDVPFVVSDHLGMSGLGEEPDDQLGLCERDGVVRARPLTPSGSPLAAADRLLAGDPWKSLVPTEGGIVADPRPWIRLQAVRAVATSQAEIHAVAALMVGQEAKDPESAWVEARDRMEAEKPRWDEAKGRFVRQK